MKRFLILAAVMALVLLAAPSMSGSAAGATGSYFQPTVAEWQFLTASTTPPTQAACAAANRRCFNPAAMANSYNHATLHTAGNMGQGITIAIVDSFGSSTIANDLKNFDTQFSLQQMCGDTGIACTSGMPKFKILEYKGSPAPKPPPPNNGTGQESRNLWALEVSLDLEWAHATAPLANILLVTTPTAETLGVQGFPNMIDAEQFVIDNHMADVISQSFAAGEGTFKGAEAALMNLRHAYVSAKDNHVTVLGSSGDGGTTNNYKQPVKNPGVIPYPSVEWPASDPLVTAVGGTYLCTDATTGTSVDTADPPSRCKPALNPLLQRETGWVASGGGYSIFFSKPAFQNTLPPGSSYVGSTVGAPGPNTNMRGVPDIAYQASATTGVLVYMTEPDTTTSGTGCGGANPCSAGWYVVGGTSSGAPQWAGIVAMADQMAGRDLGYINPGLYAVAANAVMYANDFLDVTVGNNTLSSIPGYSASQGWDAVTGLGTPNVAKLIPDLIAAIP